ncbi:MAG: enoyl-CoA hydratase/isomerase family protein [Bacteroidaceae bacterium]|nr:enoyl-CoA hydratase/isomerase family protein [Bacteroidaceae bacterium]
MEYQFLKYDNSREGICVLTIASPATLNALNTTILAELDAFVSSIDTSSTRVLIITGEGKAFVAGADIAQMSGLNHDEGYEFGRYGATIFKKIEDLEIPVIAAVNGFALGGGCELAMSCDIRVASVKASFGQPEVNLGIIPGFSGTYRLSKLVGQGIAKELIYTGDRISADEALRIGLVNKVVAPDELMDTVIAMAERILTSAPVAVRYAKRCINENYDLTADEAIALENRYFAQCFATADQKEGMSAFLEKRKPTFENK